MDDLVQRVVKLEQWRDGNGAKGAESRLQHVEEWYMKRSEVPGAVDYAVRKTLKEQGVNRRGDWNKWVNTILLLTTIGMLATALFGG